MFKSVRYIKYVNNILYLKCLLNDIFHVTDTDIFASFICEMIYKRCIYVIKHIRKRFYAPHEIIVVVSLH